MSTNLTQVSRREPYLAGSPQFTPWEENSEHHVELEGNVYVSERYRDSLVPTRPARRRVAYFLQPTGDAGPWGDWWAAAFLTAKVVLAPREGGIPRGFFTTEDYRRNIAVPPTQSYGDLVGENDGVAPYGLE